LRHRYTGRLAKTTGRCVITKIVGSGAHTKQLLFLRQSLQEILARLKDGRLKYVVATELAARGLDIPELSHVVNFELPTDAQHYVHR
jgi:ERCC4-related helicase